MTSPASGGLRRGLLIAPAAFAGAALAPAGCGSDATTLTVPPATDHSLTLTV